MRILIISTFIIILIIGGWVFAYDDIKNGYIEYTGLLDTVSHHIEQKDWHVASDKITNINKKWEETKETWTLFLPHDEIEKIDLSVARASKYIKIKNTTLAFGEIEHLKTLFAIINNNESLDITNIL